MTESESRTLTTVSSADRKATKRHLKEQLRHVRGLDGLLLPVGSCPGASKPAREVWPGYVYELARRVRDGLGAAWTQPGQFTAALQQASQRYVQKNGRDITPKVLRESLRRKDDEAKGYLRGR